MGLGDLLSGITEAEHFAREKKIFEEEVRRHPEDEMDNLRQIFVEKGMSIPDAHDLVDMIASNQNLFIEVLMNQELGLIPSNVCGASRESFVTFMSFLCFSMIPLFSYVTFPMIFSSHIGHTHMFAFSLIITSIGVFSLGFLKGMYSRKHSVRMGLEMLVQGATISLVAYLVGRVVSKSWS
jgi:vacuolar iron transporter family protein